METGGWGDAEKGPRAKECRWLWKLGTARSQSAPEAPGGTCPASTLSPGLETATSFSRCVSSH